MILLSESILTIYFAGSLETLGKERTTPSNQLFSKNVSRGRIRLDDDIASLKLCLDSLKEPNDKDDSPESEKIPGKN